MKCCWRLCLVVAAAVAVFRPPGLAAQGPALNQAVRAYEDLDYEAAAQALRRMIEQGALTPAEHAQALSYLGASEFFLGHREASVAIFRQLVALDPRSRPDPLVFPPEIQRVFDEARRGVKTIRVDVKRESVIGREPLAMRLLTTSVQDIEVSLRSRTGQTLRTLYTGPITDSIDLSWDGRTDAGDPFGTGAYVLRVSSRSASGRGRSAVERPVIVTIQRDDTLPHPRRPDESQFLPERDRRGLARSAATGLIIGVVALALPTIAGADSIVPESPLIVGGAIGLAGVAGFLLNPGGRLSKENVAYNRQLTESWQRRLDSTVAENRRRRSDIRLAIRVGEASSLEGSDQ